ncbi:MAG: toll/interleukin-1 receptor domain-containing protein [Verrucomicrobia bacterium]|nr:toll/interleukin-1 receptor domain-containing protein [Verrucomicrobiota bacterium]
MSIFDGVIAAEPSATSVRAGTPTVQLGSFDEDSWGDLLNQIEEGQVLPIVGAELLDVNVGTNHHVMSLYHWAAQALAAGFRIPSAELPESYTLNDVVCSLTDQGKRHAAYSRLTTILREARIPVPHVLEQLAEISAFKLFISTTFDGLLAEALNRTRFGGAEGTEIISFQINGAPKDLPMEGTMCRETVYQLFGKLSAVAYSFALCDDDLLEFVFALGEKKQYLGRLFNELANKNLLILGINLSDWLARLFLRIAKGTRVSQDRPVHEIVADAKAQRDQPFVLFLRHYSRTTQIYPAGDALHFVTELHRRWVERHGSAKSGKCREVRIPPPQVMPPGAVFISYPSEDVEAAWNLKTGLEGNGLAVWFDMTDLKEKAGVAYARNIEEAIQGCSLFLLVISRHTYDLNDRFFRQEWHCAEPRARRKNPERPFVLPVVVDDSPINLGQLPDYVAGLQFKRLPHGVVNPEFRNHVRKLAGFDE